MRDHPFVQPARPVTLEAHFESAPQVVEGEPSCPVCGTVVEFESVEHSIRSKPLKPREGSTHRTSSCARRRASKRAARSI